MPNDNPQNNNPQNQNAPVASAPVANTGQSAQAASARAADATARATQGAQADLMKDVAERIDGVENILVALSRNPSVDEMAAALALTVYLDSIGKHATAIYSGRTPNALEFLKPSETFEADTNSLRDFIIALNKEKADHLRYKLDGDYVKIYITPYKTNITEEDLEYTHGDYNVDLVLALNVASADELDAALKEHGKIMHDAEAVNISLGEAGKFGEVEWVDSKASSVSEMVTRLMDYMVAEKKQGQMTKEEATALLTGIVAATERFMNEKTTPETMELAAELMGRGADQQLVAENVLKREESEEVSGAQEVKEEEGGGLDVATEDSGVKSDEAKSDEVEEKPEEKPSDPTMLDVRQEVEQGGEPKVEQAEEPVAEVSEEPKVEPEVPVLPEVKEPVIQETKVAEPVAPVEQVVAPVEQVAAPVEQVATQPATTQLPEAKVDEPAEGERDFMNQPMGAIDMNTMPVQMPEQVVLPEVEEKVLEPEPGFEEKAHKDYGKMMAEELAEAAGQAAGQRVSASQLVEQPQPVEQPQQPVEQPQQPAEQPQQPVEQAQPEPQPSVLPMPGEGVLPPPPAPAVDFNNVPAEDQGMPVLPTPMEQPVAQPVTQPAVQSQPEQVAQPAEQPAIPQAPDPTAFQIPGV